MENSNYPNCDYLNILHSDDGSISLAFYIEEDDILDLGDEMNEVCEDAYMNGYNWDAFLNYYLAQHAPDILEDLQSDPEAGMYSAYYDYGGEENEKKMRRFADIIMHLVENKEEIFKILRENDDEIEWD